MRILSQSELANFGIKPSIFWDETDFYIGIAQPKKYFPKLLLSCAEFLEGSLIGFSKEDVHHSLEDNNYFCRRSGDSTSVINRNNQETIYEGIYIMKIPLRVIVKQEEPVLTSPNEIVNDFDGTKKGALYLRAKIPINTKVLNIWIERSELEEQRSRVRRNQASTSANSTNEVFVHVNWSQYIVDYRNEQCNHIFKQVFLDKIFKHRVPDNFIEKERSDEVARAKLLSESLSENLEMKFYVENLSAIINIEMLKMLLCVLLNGQIVHQRTHNNNVEVILEVSPEFEDGITFKCFQRMTKSFAKIKSDIVKELRNALINRSGITVRESTLSSRDAMVERISFQEMKLMNLLKPAFNLGTDKKSKMELRSLEDIYTSFSYIPYEYRRSPEVASWMQSDFATEIMYLLLAMSINNKSWSKAMGILSLW